MSIASPRPQLEPSTPRGNSVSELVAKSRRQCGLPTSGGTVFASSSSSVSSVLSTLRARVGSKDPASASVSPTSPSESGMAGRSFRYPNGKCSGETMTTVASSEAKACASDFLAQWSESPALSRIQAFRHGLLYGCGEASGLPSPAAVAAAGRRVPHHSVHGSSSTWHGIGAVVTMGGASVAAAVSAARRLDVANAHGANFNSGAELATVCMCGNVYMADSLYCRRCGKARLYASGESVS